MRPPTENEGDWLPLFSRAWAVIGLLITVGLLLGGVIGTKVGEYAAGILVLAAVVASTPELIQRLGKVSVGPVAVEWLSDARAAASSAVGASEDKTPIDIIDLRLRLEAKLTFIAKHILDVDGVATYVTVGSLKEDGYLTNEQARTASRIVALSDEQLAALPARQRDAFLYDAGQLVGRVRAHVFQQLLKKRLHALEYFVTLIPRGDDARPDLLVEKSGVRCRVVGVFADQNTSNLLRSSLERVERSMSRPPLVSQRIVVIPTLPENRGLVRGGDPCVVQLAGLASMLEQLSPADSTPQRT